MQLCPHRDQDRPKNPDQCTAVPKDSQPPEQLQADTGMSDPTVHGHPKALFLGKRSLYMQAVHSQKEP